MTAVLTEPPAVDQAAAPEIVVEQPGVYDGLTDDQYHADPVPGGSLSSSGAKKLLPPSCPALYRYDADHAQPPKREFEIGHAAHKLVLGFGPELVLVDRDRWDTKDVKAEIAEIRAAGNVPLKRHELEQVKAMAAKLRAHPWASKLLMPEHGAPEQSLFWVDQRTGVMRRARPDWLPTQRRGRLIVPDYKTCVKADPENLRRVIYDRGYHLQGDWYLDGVRELGLGQDPQFVLIFQEKTPPYLVTVAQPDQIAMRIAHTENRRALEVYAECKATGYWPGYSDEVETIALPGWVENQYGKDVW